MNEKFTPGPWVCEKWGGIRGSNGRLVAKIHPASIMKDGQEIQPYYDEVCQANAHLMAASKDMYEALKMAEFAIAQVPAMSEGVAKLLIDVANKIDMVLRKADGKEVTP
jgi:hypothetical protein